MFSSNTPDAKCALPAEADLTWTWLNNAVGMLPPRRIAATLLLIAIAAVYPMGYTVISRPDPWLEATGSGASLTPPVGAAEGEQSSVWTAVCATRARHPPSDSLEYEQTGPGWGEFSFFDDGAPPQKAAALQPSAAAISALPTRRSPPAVMDRPPSAESPFLFLHIPKVGFNRRATRLDNHLNFVKCAC
jgi:hypothetical protein